MNLDVKWITGHTVRVSVDADACVLDLYERVRERCVAKDRGDFDLERMVKRVRFIAGNGRSVIDLQSRLMDIGLRDESHLFAYPVPGFGLVDLRTLELVGECPVTLETFREPYPLNPGCAHVFERSTVHELMSRSLQEGKTHIDCPLCRTTVSMAPHRRILSVEEQRRMLLNMIRANK